MIRNVLVYGDGRVETKEGYLGIEHRITERLSDDGVMSHFREHVFDSVGLARSEHPEGEPREYPPGSVTRVYVEAPWRKP